MTVINLSLQVDEVVHFFASLDGDRFIEAERPVRHDQVQEFADRVFGRRGTLPMGIDRVGLERIAAARGWVVRPS